MSGLDCAPMMRMAMEQLQSLWLDPSVKLVGSLGRGMGRPSTKGQRQRKVKQKEIGPANNVNNRNNAANEWSEGGRCWGREMSRCQQRCCA